jgi:GTP cyclohydrolase II
VSNLISKSKTPLVRIHSECITGDVFSSDRCDCGEQLQESLFKIKKEGGILIYLRQEGRGIGFYNKIDAYKLQDKGYNTYEANQHLNLPLDSRDYTCAAQILKALGVYKIRLLTNNPDKIQQLENNGIQVCNKISTGVFLTNKNKRYLEAKVTCTKHAIDFTKSINF